MFMQVADDSSSLIRLERRCRQEIHAGSLPVWRVKMDRYIKALLITSVLVVPLATFAGPPAGNEGNGHGNGPGSHGSPGGVGNTGRPGKPGRPGNHGGPGDHGNPGNGDDEQGNGPGNPGSNGNGNGHGPGMAGRPGNGHGPGNDDGSGSGHIDDGGRGNSQGPAHANAHAFTAVCKHQASATHSVLGVYCGGGVVATVDAKSGVTSYTQAGLTTAPVQSAPAQSSTSPATERDGSAGRERMREPGDNPNESKL